MQTPWISHSTFPPQTGEPIEFMLEGRGQPIHGAFADGSFHSRWADYAANRVTTWRRSDGDPASVPDAATKTLPGRFVALVRSLVGRRSPNPGTFRAPGDNAGKTEAPGPVPPAAPRSRRHDSNQRSS